MKDIEKMLFSANTPLKANNNSTNLSTSTPSANTNQKNQQQQQQKEDSAMLVEESKDTFEDNETKDSKSSDKNNKVIAVRNPREAFYTVDQIIQDSPAYIAGLKTGDQVLQFGSVTKKNEVC